MWWQRSYLPGQETKHQGDSTKEKQNTKKEKGEGRNEGGREEKRKRERKRTWEPFNIDTLMAPRLIVLFLVLLFPQISKLNIDTLLLFKSQPVTKFH